MNCIFCKIVKNEIPSDTVYEDENVRVFVDAHPKAPTHLLLIPKRHIQSIGHLQDSDEEMITQLIYTAKRIAEKKKLAGYKLLFNVGREGGQMVDHLHLHLMGGWK